MMRLANEAAQYAAFELDLVLGLYLDIAGVGLPILGIVNFALPAIRAIFRGARHDDHARHRTAFERRVRIIAVEFSRLARRYDFDADASFASIDLGDPPGLSVLPRPDGIPGGGERRCRL